MREGLNVLSYTSQMFLSTIDLIFGEVNTVSIPTDSLFIFSILIFFTLFGYFFNRVLSNNTNQFAKKIVNNTDLQLIKETSKDQLKLDQSLPEKPIINSLNLVPLSQLFGFSGLAVVAVGGANILGLENFEKPYESVSISWANVKQENQSTKTPSLDFDIKPFDDTQINMKNMSTVNPLLSNLKSSKDSQIYKVKAQKIENYFSF